jgi:hypothetical protein
VELDAQQAHGGTGSVRLTDAAALQTPLIPYRQQFLRVAFSMKIDNIRRGKEPWNLAGAQISWLDAKQQEVSHTDLGLTVGTTDWKPHEASYFHEAKEEIAFFRVRLMVWDAQGTAWFDDVVVEETEPPEAFRKVPLLSEVENSVPRFWALPELQPLPGVLDVGTMQVNFTPDLKFLIRPADAKAPEVARLDIRVSSGGHARGGGLRRGWREGSRDARLGALGRGQCDRHRRLGRGPLADADRGLPGAARAVELQHADDPRSGEAIGRRAR